MQENYIFTSESVSSGHPDKLCDQISDFILDKQLSQLGSQARVAVETLAMPNKIIIAGETSPFKEGKERAYVTLKNDICDLLGSIGYHYSPDNIDINLSEQSPEIAHGVNRSNPEDMGAGDQGMVFGFACNETEDYMPSAIYYSHKILQNIEKARKLGEIEGLFSDAKSQVSINYENNRPIGINKIILSIQHDKALKSDDIRKIVLPYIEQSLPERWLPSSENILINPSGSFTIGGPQADTGLTGRKIVVDTYGGYAPHGGGAFSGKDPTKVDRSAAYAARYIAKNIVASGLTEECLIQVAYAIGIAHPVSIYIKTKGQSIEGYSLDDNALNRFIVNEILDFRPYSITQELDLFRPIYQPTSTYGHFGRPFINDGFFTWENTQKLSAILKENKAEFRK